MDVGVISNVHIGRANDQVMSGKRRAHNFIALIKLWEVNVGLVLLHEH